MIGWVYLGVTLAVWVAMAVGSGWADARGDDRENREDLMMGFMFGIFWPLALGAGVVIGIPYLAGRAVGSRKRKGAS